MLTLIIIWGVSLAGAICALRFSRDNIDETQEK